MISLAFSLPSLPLIAIVDLLSNGGGIPVT